MAAWGAFIATAVLWSLALVAGHPQYMLNKCQVPLEVGYAMMKGPARQTSEAGVSITAASDGRALSPGDSFTAGEIVQLGTSGLTQGGLAMSVSTGTFAETDASRSATLPQSIGCSGTRLSNWIGTHIEGSTDLTTPQVFPWQAPAACDGSPLTVTCAYAHAFEKVSVIAPLTLNCCPSATTFEATCGSALRSSIGNCLQCVAAHADFSGCSALAKDKFCSSGH
jgi:hypothetical protein